MAKQKEIAFFDPDHVYVVPCSQIEVVRSWNSRKGLEDGSEGPDGSTGFLGIVVSIAKNGQDTPVDLRPNPQHNPGNPASRPYLLVAGFQRYDAICQLAAGDHDALLLDTKKGGGMSKAEVERLHSEGPSIRATIAEMSDLQARARNLGENMNRNALSVPDCAFGVADLRRLNPDLKDQAIGNLIGKGQPYISQLRRITETVKGKLPEGALYTGSKSIPILDAWRIAKIKISADAMQEVGAAPVEDQPALYILKTGYKAAGRGSDGEGKKVGRGVFAENAAIEAKRFGEILGELARRGALSVDMHTMFTDENVLLLISPKQKKPKKAPSEDDLSLICSACEDAFLEARNREEASERSAGRAEELLDDGALMMLDEDGEVLPDIAPPATAPHKGKKKTPKKKRSTK